MEISSVAVMPHAPIIIPEIGGSQSTIVKDTAHYCNHISEKISFTNPDIIVMFSPHTPPIKRGYLPIRTKETLLHNLHAFGNTELDLEVENINISNKKIITDILLEKELFVEQSSSILDHGVSVPLHFILKHNKNVPFLICGPDYNSKNNSIKGAEVIKAILSKTNLNISVVASADLSHALKEDAPAGYNKNGIVFDTQLKEILENKEYSEIINIDKNISEAACQDADKTILMALALSSYNSTNGEVFSYENDFGVGYLTALLSYEGQ